jgi:hypothetical protein
MGVTTIELTLSATKVLKSKTNSLISSISSSGETFFDPSALSIFLFFDWKRERERKRMGKKNNL